VPKATSAAASHVFMETSLRFIVREGEPSRLAPYVRGASGLADAMIRSNLPYQWCSAADG
jgi:hypothetical protein